MENIIHIISVSLTQWNKLKKLHLRDDILLFFIYEKKNLILLLIYNKQYGHKQNKEQVHLHKHVIQNPKTWSYGESYKI